ncbi:MAG: hypothetical protein KatS3mg096_738 [Candidatus Parcubacteria bacterium]|nr:MAG: hypothetical protein KatS3mg096_738 [Candidatus Parcubacteria bacterium]
MPQLPQQPSPTLKTKTSTTPVASQRQTQSRGILGSILLAFVNILSRAISRGSAIMRSGGLANIGSIFRGGSHFAAPAPKAPETFKRGTFTLPPQTSISLPPNTKLNLGKIAQEQKQQELFFTSLPTAASTPSFLLKTETSSAPMTIPPRITQVNRRQSSRVSPSTNLEKSPETTFPQPRGEIKSQLPSSTLDATSFIPTDLLLQEIQNFSQQKPPEKELLSTTSNVPEGAMTYLIKDPLGGSTPVFGHIIQPGETLSKIARQYGVSIEELERLNRENKAAMKGRDLIIAGQQLHIPLKTKQPSLQEQLQKQLTTQLPKNTEEINEQQKRIKEGFEAIKRGEIPQLKAEDMPAFMMYLMGEELRMAEEHQRRLEQYYDPNFYQQQYQQLVKQSGLEDLYQRYFDLNKVLQGTRDDVMREAAMAGGIVTQSQVEEIVAWRQSLLRGQMQALSDLIDHREKMIDRAMNFIRMDRTELRSYLDDVFKIKERTMDLMEKYAYWGLNYYDDIQERNRSKLTTLLNSGALGRMSLEYLAEYANPDSPLYSGYTFEELLRFWEVSRMINEKKEEEIKKLKEQIEQAQRRLKIAEQRLLLQQERLEFQRQKEQQKSSNKKTQKRSSKENLIEHIK